MKKFLAVLIAVLAVSFAPVYGAESADIISLKLGSPLVYDFEYEHAFPSKIGVTLGGTVLSVSSTDESYSLTYINAGVRKYFSDNSPKGGFVSGRLGMVMWSVEEDVLDTNTMTTNTFTGDATMMVAIASIGYRWIWGGFTLCPEFGFGYFSLDEIDLEYGSQKRKYDVSFSGVMPTLNLSMGLKF